MSETTPAPQSMNGAPLPDGTQAGPPLVVNIQFVKDLSFEVPGAPEIFSTLRSQPNVQINLDVQARRLQDGQNVFEVVLVTRATSDISVPSSMGVKTTVLRISNIGLPSPSSAAFAAPVDQGELRGRQLREPHARAQLQHRRPSDFEHRHRAPRTAPA